MHDSNPLKFKSEMVEEIDRYASIQSIESTNRLHRAVVYI